MIRGAGWLLSSVGSKVVVALTGAALGLFVIAHLAGNLQIFLGRGALNAYAAKLHHLGPLLWVARGGLILCAAVHVGMTIRLELLNRAARPVAYTRQETLRATLSSRTMIWSGLVLLAFLVYHLLHFTFGTVDPGAFGLTERLADGSTRRDVYSMVVRAFQDLRVSAAYIAAMALLGMHLRHGGSSLFQSLGVRSPRLEPVVRGVGPVAGVLLAAGNISIPVAVLLGWVSLPPGVGLP